MKGGTPGKGVTPGAEGYHAKVGVGSSWKMGGKYLQKKIKGSNLRTKIEWRGGVAERNTNGEGNKTERPY